MGGTIDQPLASETAQAATSRWASVPSGKSHSGCSKAIGLYTTAASWTPGSAGSSPSSWASRPPGASTGCGRRSVRQPLADHADERGVRGDGQPAADLELPVGEEPERIRTWFLGRPDMRHGGP